MPKPAIGVMPLWDDEKNSIWMLPGYFDGISQAGGIPVMLPFTKEEQETDQLFICPDIVFYGQSSGILSFHICLMRTVERYSDHL